MSKSYESTQISDFSEIFCFHKTFLQLVRQFLYLICYTRSIFILLVANEGCNNHCTDPKCYDQGRYFSLTKIFFCSLHFAQWFKKIGSCIIKFWFLAQLVLHFFKKMEKISKVIEIVFIGGDLGEIWPKLGLII